MDTQRQPLTITTPISMTIATPANIISQEAKPLT